MVLVGIYSPDIASYDKQPWADGPCCPQCYRELEENLKGFLLKKIKWYCPLCNNYFKRPRGNKMEIKEAVEKDYAAILRKRGQL